jgi:Helicase conserved C-terminal domain/SNF2-related domain
MLHPIQRRYLAEDLVRLRRSDESRRYAAPQRAARIDPNPHQIDAVMFALSRLREGGCILADEVGLGKTIEAGLVIAQMLAEGAKRVLLVAPKPLLGQWRQELYALFGLDVREGRPEPGGFDGHGVFVAGRETVGSERGRDALVGSAPFDLCVVDEAHEMFAGIYKRFDQDGVYQEESPHARIAGRLREVVGTTTPVILLTATPIQNTLTELWGLVQYVDPTNTLLGDLPTFRAMFCAGDDRSLVRGQEGELRERLEVVLQRTLRRQAQEFLRQPFVDREARLFEYTMSAEEKALYDDVTAYLLEPGIVAFQGSHRQLLLVGFHRLMASSTRALAASLDKVAARLRRKLEAGAGGDAESEAKAFLGDLEDDEKVAVDEADAPIAVPPEVIRAELARVEGLARRAHDLREDSKVRALLQAVDVVIERGKRGEGSGKVIVFTESLVTQDYLRDLLVQSGLVTAGEVTRFRGSNDSVEALAALARWRVDIEEGMPAHTRPSADIAVRLALVHEFRTRSKVFVSTEAGGKGLNLQFCDTLVNFDLPWNPQRIEQRIGRCHRYGQRHAVTVVNFLARENEAQRLTFEILSQKLELFGTVLDASDQVLHRASGAAPETLAGAFGSEIETELRKIYDRSRTLEEVEAELRALRERVGESRKRFEEIHVRTASAIDQHFDTDVQRVFKRHQEQVPAALKELDRDLERLVRGYLDSASIPYERSGEGEGTVTLRIAASPRLPASLAAGISVVIGAATGRESLHLGHPLVLAALDEARSACSGPMAVRATVPDDAAPSLVALRGRRGRLGVVKARHDGFEAMEQLLVVVVVEGQEVPVAASDAEALLHGAIAGADLAAAAVVPDEVFDDAIDELLFALEGEVGVGEQRRLARSLEQVDRAVEDRILLLRRRRDKLQARLDEATHRRDVALGPDARANAEQRASKVQEELDETELTIDRLARRDDPTFRRWRDKALGRRRTAPAIERIVDVALVIA